MQSTKLIEITDPEILEGQIIYAKWYQVIKYKINSYLRSICRTKGKSYQR